MKALLSICLSCCLLLSSITPALSQIVPGKIVPAVVKGLDKTIVDNALLHTRLSTSLRKLTGGVVKMTFPGNPTGPLTKQVEFQAFQASQLNSQLRYILTLPDNAETTLNKAALMRSEMAPLAIVLPVPPKELARAEGFFQEDLLKNAAQLKELDGISAEELLNRAVPQENTFNPAFAKYLEVVSSATSLAAIGSKTEKNIHALTYFHSQAAQGPLKEVADAITARGLLRWQAYDAFNQWMNTITPEGLFWVELAKYIKINELPVAPFEATVSGDVRASAKLAEWLKQGNLLNVYHADPLREATEQWILLGASEGLGQMEGAVQTQDIIGKGLRHTKPVNVEDDPKLHEASQIKTVSDGLLDYMQEVSAADEVEGVTDQLVVDFAKDGFLMTLEKGGKEQILPVSLRISNRFLNRNWDAFWANHSETPYNRVVIKPEPRLKKGDYELEMRNKTRTPSKMDHFYFRLQKNQVGLLVDMLNRVGVDKFFLKLEANPKKFYKHIDLPVYREGTMETTPLIVSVPEKQYKKGDTLVLLQTGELGWLSAGSEQITPIKDLYVRLPKHQMTELVKVLEAFPANGSEKLNLSIRPTSNGANFISMPVSMSNLSLGKTFGPMVHGPLNISEKAATDMMFGINYVLPGLASLLTPVLKKYGERKMMAISVGLSLASGLLATAGGFYGAVTGMTLGPLQKVLFVVALLSMSVSSILKQLTANLLIRANGGEIEYKDASKNTKVEVKEVRTETPKQLLKRRAKEFVEQLFLPATKHTNPSKYNAIKEKMAEDEKDVQLSHLIRYNLGFIFKNVGTLTFLALPYIINGIGKLFGADLGLDFSVSFPIYAAFSGYLTWRMFRVKLRDAYSAKNVTDSHQAIAKAVAKLSDKVSATQGMEEAKREDIIDTKTRALYDAVTAYVLAQQKVGSKLKRSELLMAAKKEALLDLKNSLKEQGLPKEEIVKVLKGAEDKLYTLDNAFLNMLGMFKVPGVAALAAGMTMATVHEFVVSSSFAGTMNHVISHSDLANFLVALTLYAPMIAGRIGGNWLSRKITPGSMYMFCSSLSALGTLMVGLSQGNVPTMIAGAGIASIGMGNYYTQMYNYIMERHEKYRREINSLLALTMAFGGLGAMASPTGIGLSGNPAWDMVFAGGLLVVSWLCTRPMFASSSLIKAFKATPFGQKVMKFVRARYEADQNSATVKHIKKTHQKVKQKRKEVQATIQKNVHREKLIDYEDLDDAQGAF